jgi:hypothetical protein
LFSTQKVPLAQRFQEYLDLIVHGLAYIVF